jgi:hypothetical protein
MNVATAASFLSDEFETEILLSKNALVFLHGLGHSLPICPDGNVRFDQQRTRAEL